MQVSHAVSVETGAQGLVVDPPPPPLPPLPPAPVLPFLVHLPELEQSGV